MSDADVLSITGQTPLRMTQELTFNRVVAVVATLLEELDNVLFISGHEVFS